MTEHYDVIIIGTGAGGGTLAYALADTGKRILLLDRGGYLPREKSNWNPDALYLNQRYRTDERWLDNQGNVFQPSLYHQVGGSTKVYGAALLRMRQQDFEDLEHRDGLSPAWPVDYDAFAPYYDRAEKVYKVHGRRGSDPTEPPCSQSYPYPALPHEPRIQAVADRLQQLGLHPFELPMGIDRDVSGLNSPCIRCDTCDGYPCLVDAKADAQVCCVDKALQQENVTLIPNADVEQLLTDSSGASVTSVVAIINGQRQVLKADIVVVSCGAINSAALLLKSASNQHPNGLANSSGMVGRNLMKHNVTKLFAVAPQRNETAFQKTLAINDFYFGSDQHDYPLGHVHLMGKHKWQMMRSDFPKWVVPEVLDKIAARSVDWWLQSEDLPQFSNHIEVNAEGKIVVYYQPNNLKAHHQFNQTFKQVLRQAGFPIIFSSPVPLQVMNHQVGTCRFGHNPKTSVLDVNCKAHDLDNLYVVDTSFFPSISATNPTLTIAANAFRVADHLRARLGKSLMVTSSISGLLGADLEKSSTDALDSFNRPSDR
ncbi:MAG: GMC family oxidoreductase [Thermosynechococcaceae cyanobacterium]